MAGKQLGAYMHFISSKQNTCALKEIQGVLLVKVLVPPRSWNTYLDTYSEFSITFLIFFRIYFCFIIIYAIVFHWIRIRGLGVSSGLNRRPDLSLLLDLVFLVVRSDRFQFQTSFSNILDFL